MGSAVKFPWKMPFPVIDSHTSLINTYRLLYTWEIDHQITLIYLKYLLFQLPLPKNQVP